MLRDGPDEIRRTVDGVDVGHIERVGDVEGLRIELCVEFLAYLENAPQSDIDIGQRVSSIGVAPQGPGRSVLALPSWFTSEPAKTV